MVSMSCSYMNSAAWVKAKRAAKTSKILAFMLRRMCRAAGGVNLAGGKLKSAFY